MAECASPDGTMVALGDALVDDVCDAAPVVANDAPELFPLGETDVTWTATDASGNSASDTQLVTVEDTTPPEITASLQPVDGKSLKSKKGEFTVQFSCSDACDENAGATATINGVEVENGQVVDLRLKSAKSDRSQKSEKSRKSGKSDKPDRIEGPAEDLVLVVVCTDAAGNTTEVTVTPEFAEKSAKSAKSKKSGKRRS